MATVKGPVIGLPAGTKEQGQRVDFKKDAFSVLIATKGIRLAWSRSAPCPCDPVNTQTRQPDPNCTLCQGIGFLWFRPIDYAVPEEAGQLSDVQQAILDDEKAVIIRGVSVGVRKNTEPYDKVGQWVSGSSSISVRPENRLGYYDRLTAIDAEMAYGQIVFLDETDPTQAIKLRYKATCINLLRSTEKVYKSGADFTIDSSGDVQFIAGREPPVGERLTVHYLHHPVGLVTEFMHAFRDSLVAFKSAKSALITPQGNPQTLPLQVMVRLEFLVLEEAQEE